MGVACWLVLCVICKGNQFSFVVLISGTCYYFMWKICEILLFQLGSSTEMALTFQMLKVCKPFRYCWILSCCRVSWIFSTFELILTFLCVLRSGSWLKIFKECWNTKQGNWWPSIFFFISFFQGGSRLHVADIVDSHFFYITVIFN